MESMILPVLSFSILLTLLMAAVIFLSVQQTRQSQQSLRFLSQLQQSQQESLQANLQATLTASRDSLTETVQQLSGHHSASLEQAQQAAWADREQTHQLLTSTISDLTRSSSSAVAQLTALTQATTNLLATKDAVAYQMVTGAQVAATAPDSAPYTSTVERAEMVAAQGQQDQLVRDALQKITGMAEGNGNGEFDYSAG